MSTRQKLETLVTCSAVWEAEIIRDRLEAAGLLAFVQGAETGRSLSYVGFALGGIKVQVPTDQLRDARKLLDSDAAGAATQSPWKCPRCGEPNDATFDICYSCSMPRPVRESSGRQTKDLLNEEYANSVADHQEDCLPPTCAQSPSPTPNITRNSSDGASLPSYDAAENAIRKAMITTVFGCIFPLPPVFLLSMVFAFRGWINGGKDNPQLRLRIGGIVLCDLIALVVTSFLFWSWGLP